MRAGLLDRRIELQHRTLTRDSHGQEVESFATYVTVWAQKRDTRGREAIASQQEFAENTAAFLVRWRSDVLRTDRIVYGSAQYNIRQIAEIGRTEGMELLCDAVVA